jgi:integrase
MDLTAFKEWLLINGASQASVKTRCDKIALFFSQYEVFNQENLNAFLASKLNVWNGNSFNIFRNALYHYVKFLKVDIELPHSHKIHKRVKEYLTEQEVNEILPKLDLIFDDFGKSKAIFILLFTTGLRPKELLQLKREDFNFETKTLAIKDTKTYQDRNVALSDELCKMLPAIFNQEKEEINAFNIVKGQLEYIFTRINQSHILKIKLSPYSLRHSYAHNLIDMGINLRSLQSGMGHSNPLTTLGYLNVSEKQAQEEIRNLINKRRKK